MELTEFLTARLDEEEAAAREDEHPDIGAERPVWLIDWGEMGISTARVLAQVAAMRAVLDAWPDTFGQWNAEQADAARAVKDMIRRKLAAIWSSHPDYDPSWSPTAS